MTPAPTVARSIRDASLCSSNCHQSSCEYSTCLNANNPSQSDAPTAATTAMIQPGENRVSNNAARRSNAGRARQSTRSDRGEDDRLFVVCTLEERCRDACEHRQDGQDVRGIEPARESLREQQQRRAEHAASEMRHLDHAERKDAVEKAQTTRRGRRGARERSTTPARKVNAASTRGVSCSVNHPNAAPSRAACDRRWWISSATSTTAATDSGSR